MSEIHTKYIDNLSALQDAEGKRLSGAMLEAVKKIHKASSGNPVKFAAMLKVLRSKILAEAVVEVRKSQIQAGKLGKEFGEQKLNAGD
jgi:hypothetical protein